MYSTGFSYPDLWSDTALLRTMINIRKYQTAECCDLWYFRGPCTFLSLCDHSDAYGFVQNVPFLFLLAADTEKVNTVYSIKTYSQKQFKTNFMYLT